MARMMINDSSNGGGAEAEEKGGSGLKKGPWTAEEDEILVEYVRRRGEGNWNAVQKNTGLARCGKSCRLRWANHLRPNLKKGAFSSQEEKIIIELHAKLGNKWARMASQLPGRTDNEIKNYWNTRVKRRQRAGLPLYPIELLQQEQPQQQVQENHQITQNSHSSSSSSFSSLLSQNRPDLSLYNNFSHPTMNQLSYNNVALPINCQLPQFQPNIAHALPNTPSFQCNPGGTFGTFRSMLTGPPYDPLGRLMQELPSTQTPASLDASGGAADAGLWGRAEISSSTTAARDQYYDFLSQEWRLAGNSGLLDDLLEEARALSTRKQRNDESYEVEEKEKSVSREESVKKEEDDDDGGVQSESVLKNSGETSTFSSCDQSSVGIGPSGDQLDVSSMDDDLMSLLNYFPTSMPVPDWYPGGGGGGRNLSDRETSVITSGFARHDLVNGVPQNASSVQVAKQPELELLLEQRAWPRLRKY